MRTFMSGFSMECWATDLNRGKMNTEYSLNRVKEKEGMHMYLMYSKTLWCLKGKKKKRTNISRSAACCRWSPAESCALAGGRHQGELQLCSARLRAVRPRSHRLPACLLQSVLLLPGLRLSSCTSCWLETGIARLLLFLIGSSYVGSKRGAVLWLLIRRGDGWALCPLWVCFYSSVFKCQRHAVFLNEAPAACKMPCFLCVCI